MESLVTAVTLIFSNNRSIIITVVVTKLPLKYSIDEQWIWHHWWSMNCYQMITANRERFAGLNFHVLRFSRVPQKFSHEYKCLSLIILNNEHFWSRQHKSIPAKTLVGLKLWTFSSANLSMSTVYWVPMKGLDLSDVVNCSIINKLVNNSKYFQTFISIIEVLHYCKHTPWLCWVTKQVVMSVNTCS